MAGDLHRADAVHERIEIHVRMLKRSEESPLIVPPAWPITMFTFGSTEWSVKFSGCAFETTTLEMVTCGNPWMDKILVAGRRWNF